MSKEFTINGIKWNVQYVSHNADILRNNINILALGVTDFDTKTVYISRQISGELLNKVLLHEICHCVIFSYNVRWCAGYEEELCNFIAMHANKIVAFSQNLTERNQKRGVGAL